MTLKTIVFDMDETLIPDNVQGEGALLATARLLPNVEPVKIMDMVTNEAEKLFQDSSVYDICESLGISYFECLWGSFHDQHSDLLKLSNWVPEFRKRTWSKVLQDLSEDPKLALTLSETFCLERRSRHVTYEETIGVLNILRENYSLILLTNGSPSLQREKIVGTGIGGFFDDIVISGEVGVGKPAPEMFSAVTNRVGGAPDEVVMVGDSLPRDIAGAQKVGWRAVWINRNEEVLPAEYTPDIVLATLSALPESLGDM